MKVSLVKPDLHQIDRVSVDTFVLPVFDDHKPPRGLTGLVDWRLCGMMSRMLAGGRVSTRFRDVTLLPAYGRFAANRILVFGMGNSDDFSQARAREVAWFMAEKLLKLRTPTFLTCLPGSAAGMVHPRSGMELFLEEFSRIFGSDEMFPSLEVHMVEAQEYHRDLNDMILVATRRLRGIWK
ncbi:MAG TPA: M17 family peptidase N-terminal domain-containing protein [Myxococcota bacterium]|nr:M17 family peptidase N-terminal domain-containing protein [Myxococcota bacterium]HQP94573.1 M17 family peptidase N-terminal domain-containing protein [Myxococcota bacterium]